ncbi:hypothetical protein BT69DRAFT_394207 [Atractiella rhizophila]|nr:hypothetical protein BT69DRAFT_394207 [Atractiella rhizophila]
MEESSFQRCCRFHLFGSELSLKLGQSEMTEQLRLQRAETVRSRYGVVFVKLIKMGLAGLPVPTKPTFFTCVMSNGETDVSTKDTFRLAHDVRLNQEWELNYAPRLTCSLRFQLQIDPNRDFHLLPPRPVTPTSTESKHRSGLGRLFGSPKKAAKSSPAREPIPPSFSREPLLYHCRNDGVFARTVIDFSTEQLQGSYLRKRRILQPLMSPISGNYRVSQDTAFTVIEAQSQSSGSSSSGSSTAVSSSYGEPMRKGDQKPIGHVELEILRLPYLPGIGRNAGPINLDKAMFGLKSLVWHDTVFHEGFLNHRRRDLTWRRQYMQLKGARLRAFNDVVTSPLFQLDLLKVVAIEDNNLTLLTSIANDDDDEYMHVPRSFRLIFNDKSEVHFYAGTDEEKREWMAKLKDNILERIPERPLWTEVLRKELQKQRRGEGKAPAAPPK